MNDLTSTIQALTHPDEQVRQAAVHILLLQDEAIIGKLIDEFYAGVGLARGTALLDVIGQIGGYEAVALLKDVVDHPSAKQEWREVALRWLRHDGFI
jgi:hypothetical protein